jgi:hypothetical protein
MSDEALRHVRSDRRTRTSSNDRRRSLRSIDRKRPQLPLSQRNPERSFNVSKQRLARYESGKSLQMLAKLAGNPKACLREREGIPATIRQHTEVGLWAHPRSHAANDDPG